MVRFKSDDAIWQAPLMVALAIASVAPAFAATLEIAVTGVRDGNGWLDVCVFNSAKGFPNCGEDRSILSRRLPASPGTTRIDVDVAPGVHAVSVLHDENGNGQLDTNFLGMPREGGGVSNNPPPQMHPPRFADAVFDVPLNGGQIIIKMVYP